MKKILSYFVIAMMLLAGCKKEEADVKTEQGDQTAPQSVTGLTAEEKDTTVVLHWSMPDDKDISTVQISYSGQEISLPQGSTSYEIKGLKNFCAYTFSLTVVDRSGNRSQASSISASPKIECSIQDGFQLGIGKYKDLAQTSDISLDERGLYIYTDGSSCSTGSLKYLASGAAILDLTKKRNGGEINVISFRTDTINGLLGYQTKEGTFIAIGLFEKTEGESGKLAGKYASYKHSAGEFPFFHSRTDIELSINDKMQWKLIRKDYSTDGSIESKNSTQEGTITDTELRNQSCLLLHHQGRCYLKLSGQVVYKKI